MSWTKKLMSQQDRVGHFTDNPMYRKKAAGIMKPAAFLVDSA
ncbi:hypothetical protein [Lentibacillus halophilus]